MRSSHGAVWLANPVFDEEESVTPDHREGDQPDEVCAVHRIYYAFQLYQNLLMTTNNDDGEPKFLRLLAFLVLAVVICALLTWVMAAYFPDFPNFD